MISTTAPTDPVSAFIAELAALRSRIGDLERAAGQSVRTGCSISRSTNQSIPNNTPTDVSFTTEAYDSDSYIAVTATTVTIPAGKGGLYGIAALVNWASSPSASGWVEIGAGGRNYVTSAAGNSQQGHGLTLPLDVGDTVKVSVYQLSGGALNLSSAFLDVYLIGA